MADEEEVTEITLGSSAEIGSLKVFSYSISGRPCIYIEGEDRAHNILTSQGDYQTSVFQPFLQIWRTYGTAEGQYTASSYHIVDEYRTNPVYEFDAELDVRKYRFLIRLYDKMPLEDEYTNFDQAIVDVIISAPYFQYVAVQDCRERISDSDSPEDYDFDSIQGKASVFAYMKAGISIERIEVYASTEGEDFEPSEANYIKTIYPNANEYNFGQSFNKIHFDIVNEIEWYQDYYIKLIPYDNIGPGATYTTYGYICGSTGGDSCLMVKCIDFIVDEGYGGGTSYIEENTVFYKYRTECPYPVDTFYLSDWNTAYYNLSASSYYGTYYREYMFVANPTGDFADSTVGGTHLEVYNSVLNLDVRHYIIGKAAAVIIEVKGPKFWDTRREIEFDGVDWGTVQNTIQEYNSQPHKKDEIEKQKDYYLQYLEDWDNGRESLVPVWFNIGNKSIFQAYTEITAFSIYTIYNEEGEKALKDTRIAIGYGYTNPKGELDFVPLIVSEPVEQRFSEEVDESEYDDRYKEIIPTRRIIENRYTFAQYPENFFGEEEADKQVVFRKTVTQSTETSVKKDRYYVYFYRAKLAENGSLVQMSQPKFWYSLMENKATYSNITSTTTNSYPVTDSSNLLYGRFKFLYESSITGEVSERIFNMPIASSIEGTTQNQFCTTYSFPARGVREPQSSYGAKYEGELLDAERTEYIFDTGWLMIGDVNGQEVSKIKTMSFVVPNEEIQDDIVARRVRLEFHYRADDYETCYWSTSGEAQKDTYIVGDVTYYGVKFSDINIPYYKDSTTGWKVYAIEQDDTILRESFPVCVSNGIVTVKQPTKNSNNKYKTDFYKKRRENAENGETGITKLSYSYPDLPQYEPEHTRQLLIVGEWFGLFSLSEYKECNITYNKRKYGVTRPFVTDCFFDAYRVGMYMELEPYWEFDNPVNVKGFRKTY